MPYAPLPLWACTFHLLSRFHRLTRQVYWEPPQPRSSSRHLAIVLGEPSLDPDDVEEPDDVFLVELCAFLGDDFSVLDFVGDGAVVWCFLVVALYFFVADFFPDDVLSDFSLLDFCAPVAGSAAVGAATTTGLLLVPTFVISVTGLCVTRWRSVACRRACRRRTRTGSAVFLVRTCPAERRSWYRSGACRPCAPGGNTAASSSSLS